MTEAEMVAALKAKGYQVEEPWTTENCKHPPRMVMGSGSCGSDGSSSMSWHCRQCGKSDSYKTPANPNLVKLHSWG